MDHSRVWHLCNTKTQAQFSELTPDDIVEKLQSIDKSHLSEWQVWCDGFDAWKPVIEVESIKLLLAQFKKAAAPPPIPQSKHTPPPPPFAGAPKKHVNDENMPKAPKAKGKSGPEQRKYPRIELKLRVLLRSDQITFRTFTRNLSGTGVALEHDVPADLLGKDCKMYISDPETQANIRFDVKLVPNRTETRFFEFTDLSKSDEQNFVAWLNKFQASKSA